MALKHLRIVHRRARAVIAAERARDSAIVTAHRSGETFRDIAKYAGLSHQRIHQIVQGSTAAAEDEDGGDEAGEHQSSRGDDESDDDQR